MKSISLFVVAALALSCGRGQDAAPEVEGELSQEVNAHRYLDLDSVLSSDDQTKWWEVRVALKHDFDAICPDTFCEGEYANLESLGVTCTAHTQTKKVGECAWVFAGSNTRVVASNGRVVVYPKVYTCRVSVNATADQLVATLSQPGSTEPLHRALPGSTKSLYDALIDCL